VLPNKSHLQLIVKELEKFESELHKSYNFQEFIDRCRAIFSPEVQRELDFSIARFEDRNLIDTLTAQNLLYKNRVLGQGGNYVLRLTYDDKPSQRINVSMNSLEYGLRSIVVWCRKQLIKLIKDENVEFDKVAVIDLENGGF